MKRGVNVRITSSRLGLVESQASTRFEDEHIERGDLVSYWGPDEHRPEWHWLRATVDGRELWCPAHESMFELPTG